MGTGTTPTSTTSAAGRNETARVHHHRQHLNPHNHRHDFLPLTTYLIIIIPIVIIILLFSIFLIAVMLRRLKPAKTDAALAPTNSNCMFIAHSIISFSSNPDAKGGCLNGGLTSTPSSARFRGVQVFTYKELQAATENFSQHNVIGTGSFGVVYRGVLADGMLAAVKVLRRDGKQRERAFRLEVDLLSRLQCPYLVELLGYCADEQHRLLIFEFMSNGTLQDHLEYYPSCSNGSKESTLNWGVRLRIALDCARALEFLHEHTTPSIIHRDFKSSNILLDHNFRAKVSDFGLAKMGSDKINGQISTRVLGTTGYLAPEYASTGKLTTKSDVYSYGVVLLQLLTGRVPVDTKMPPGEHVLVSWALPRLTNRDKVMEMVDPSLQGQYSRKELIQVAAIAAMCVQTEAEYRPLMTDVVQSLIPLAKNLSSSAGPSGSFRFSKKVSPRSN